MSDCFSPEIFIRSEMTLPHALSSRHRKVTLTQSQTGQHWTVHSHLCSIRWCHKEWFHHCWVELHFHWHVPRGCWFSAWSRLELSRCSSRSRSTSSRTCRECDRYFPRRSRESWHQETIWPHLRQWSHAVRHWTRSTSVHRPQWRTSSRLVVQHPRRIDWKHARTVPSDDYEWHVRQTTAWGRRRAVPHREHETCSTWHHDSKRGSRSRARILFQDWRSLGSGFDSFSHRPDHNGLDSNADWIWYGQVRWCNEIPACQRSSTAATV